jgi:hypothetical protein
MGNRVRHSVRAAGTLALVACVGCASALPAPRAAVDPAREPPPHLVLAEATPAPAEATPAPEPSQPPPPRKHGGSGQALGLASLSVGAGAGILAIITSFMMLHDKSARDAGCNAQKLCTTDALSANTTLANLSGWNTGAYAVAAVGLVAGAVLLIAFPGERSKSTAVVVTSNGAGAGLGLRSTF